MKRKIDKNRPASMGAIPWRMMLGALLLCILASVKSPAQTATPIALPAELDNYVATHLSDQYVMNYHTTPSNLYWSLYVTISTILDNPGSYSYSASELAEFAAMLPAIVSKGTYQDVMAAAAAANANGGASPDDRAAIWHAYLLSLGTTMSTPSGVVTPGTPGATGTTPIPSGKIQPETPVISTP